MSNIKNICNNCLGTGCKTIDFIEPLVYNKKNIRNYNCTLCFGNGYINKNKFDELDKFEMMEKLKKPIYKKYSDFIPPVPPSSPK